MFFKVMFQELCRTRSNWDDLVRNEIKSDWVNYLEKLCLIKSVIILRLVFSLNFNLKSVSIHGFCDASLLVYAAVVYVKSYKRCSC